MARPIRAPWLSFRRHGTLWHRDHRCPTVVAGRRPKFGVSGVGNVPKTGPVCRGQPHRLHGLHLRRYPRPFCRASRVRFMAKKEVFDNKIAGPLMRRMRHIPVDCGAGAESYARPSTISSRANSSACSRRRRSPQLRDQGVPPGAARMALGCERTDHPLTVMSQRIWTNT